MSDIKPTKTLTYKTVGKLEIPLDIYLPENPERVPVLLWFHGGGLLQGRRDSLAAHMRKGVSKYGYACVSADYRLAPQVSVKDILDDVRDCVDFIRNKLATHIDKKDALDVKRLAVSGSSAGGYLALLAGLYVEPKPQVILPIYPITDPLGTFFTNPQPPPMGRYAPSKEEMEPYLDPKAAAVANCEPLPNGSRSHMYVHMLESANLAHLLGVPKSDDALPFRISRNVYGRRLPPAYFLHGDADSAVGKKSKSERHPVVPTGSITSETFADLCTLWFVGVEQSDEVVGAMLGLGIDVQYERPHGKDHFLDGAAEYENDAFYSFMLKNLNYGGKAGEKEK